MSSEEREIAPKIPRGGRRLDFCFLIWDRGFGEQGWKRMRGNGLSGLDGGGCEEKAREEGDGFWRTHTTNY
jgi:hypothetical protein